MKRNGGYDTAAGMLLIFVFACTIFFTLAAGAGIYKEVSRTLETEYTSRTAVGYVAAKVRSCDAEGGVKLGKIGDVNALVLHEEYYGVAYDTYIYYLDGYIRELFCAEGEAFKPEDGLAVTEALSLDFSKNGRLIKISCSTENETAVQYICLNAEGS